MKSILTPLFIALMAVSSFAQKSNPVSWTFEVKSIDENVYEIHFKASLDDKWAIYSQNNSEDGPIPTSFTFESAEGLSLEKGVQEKGDLLSGYDEYFDMEVKKFKNSVDFVQTVKMQGKKAKLTGYITYMTCDDKRCLPPRDEEFEIIIK